jgi:DNA-binding Lrp family transcriptional regulator
MKCFEKNCSECGKKLKLFGGYRHPVLGRKECICKLCFQKINPSEERYTNFILHSTHHTDGIWAACFVLIKTAPTYEKFVFNQLNTYSEIIDIHPLLGSYDLIVKIEATNSEKLSNFVLSKIRTIKGIENTKTLTGTFSIRG